MRSEIVPIPESIIFSNCNGCPFYVDKPNTGINKVFQDLWALEVVILMLFLSRYFLVKRCMSDLSHHLSQINSFKACIAKDIPRAEIELQFRNMFIAPKNLGIDIKIIKFEPIVMTCGHLEVLVAIFDPIFDYCVTYIGQHNFV